MRKYQVYGDYGYGNETLLGNFDDLEDAIKWATTNYDESMTEYRIVEVARFAEDGEYICVYAIHQDD